HSGQTDCTSLALAEWLCRTDYRIDPARVFGPHHCLGRGTSAPESNFLCRSLQLRQNASVVAQGCADFSSDSTQRNHSLTPDPRRASPALGLSFRYTQLCCPKGPFRRIPRNQHEAARDITRSFAATETFEQSRRERKKIEMRSAHLKRILRLGRLQLRGPRGGQDEFVLAAIAQNLRRLASLVARSPPAQALCRVALELRRERQGRRIQATALNERYNGPIRCG